MKKTFTLFCAIVLFAGVFAQRGRDGSEFQARYGKPGYVNQVYAGDFLIRQRNEMIVKINFEYDARIHAVKHTRAKWQDKKNAIRRLEKERQDQIKMAYAFYDLKNKRNYPHPQKGSYAIH